MKVCKADWKCRQRMNLGFVKDMRVAWTCMQRINLSFTMDTRYFEPQKRMH